MTVNNGKMEKILSQALELYEKGKSISEILDLCPDYRGELTEMFQTIKVLTQEKGGIIPPKELLAKIISQIQPIKEVTKAKEGRYSYRGEIKGRPSLISIIINQISNLMTWNWKVFLPIGVVVVLVAVVLYSQVGRGPQVAEEQLPSPIAEKPDAPIAEKPAVLPPATGNADDAVNAVIAAVNNELAVLDEETNDVSLVELDSQAISDFGQTYNESEF